MKTWILVALCAWVFGCASSEHANWAQPCFEARELESWPDLQDEPCTVEIDEGPGGEIEERRVNVFGDDGWVSTTTYASGEIAERRVEYTDQHLMRLIEEYGRDGELLSRTEHVFDDEAR